MASSGGPNGITSKDSLSSLDEQSCEKNEVILLLMCIFVFSSLL